MGSFLLAIDSLALSMQRWPFSLEWLPTSAYLVGGAVRDILLGRSSQRLDLDFVLAEKAVETADAIARHYQAGFVLLDAERQIARVVFEQATADFALQVGSSLETDLRRRDFTINAIAYSPHTQTLSDPLQGFTDLQQGLIRMICRENLQEDPLRLLRAYRQAAQLGFTVESTTRKVIQQLASLLMKVAAERVQTELRYLLSHRSGTPWLIAAWQDGLLQDWFSQTSLPQLSILAAIDAAAETLNSTHPKLVAELHRPIRDSAFASPSCPRPPESLSSGDRSWLSLAKLSCLLSSTPEHAILELSRLRYSRSEIRAAGIAVQFLPRLCDQPQSMSLKEQYDFFQNVGPVFPVLVILSVAAGVPLEVILPLVKRYLTPTDVVAHPQPLMTGQELMAALHLKPGPLIGQLLAAIQLAQAEGKVSTPSQALEFAIVLLQPEEQSPSP